MPKLSQVWFPSGEELGADDISGRGGYTRRYLSINYSPPGASDEPALNVEHTPIASALNVPGLKVFAGPYSVGDAILVEKVVQTGNFLAGEYQGADIFSIAGAGDIWTAGTIEAEKANAGGVVAAVDGTTALDLTTGNVFTCTPAENTSWSTSAPTNGIGGQRVSFVVDNSGGFTVAWAAGFTNVDSIGATDTGISVRTLQFDGTTWHQIAATLDGDAINAGSGDVDGSGTADYIPKWLDADTLTDSIIHEIAGEIGIGAAPNEVLTVEGVLSLKEGVAPSNTADYGKLYVKASDSGLYFMEDDGTEHDLLAGGASVWRTDVNENLLGPASAAPIVTGDENTVGGFGAGAALTTGDGNTIYGWGAGAAINNDSYCTFIGWGAGAALFTGNGDVFIGAYAGYGALDSYGNNIGIGASSLNSLDKTTSFEAFANIGIGNAAGADITTGSDVICIGYHAGHQITTTDGSIAIGEYALQGLVGADNIAIGRSTMWYTTIDAESNTTVGYSGMYSVNGTPLSGDRNSAFGYRAGYYIQGASNRNVYLGESSGPASGTEEDDQLYIGNSTDPDFIQGTIGTGITIDGDVDITGALTKGSGTFKIQHPLEDEKHLYHGFIEGPEYGLRYRGKVVLKNGKAKVDIDAACRMSKGVFEAIAMNATVYLQNQTGFSKVHPTELHGAEFGIVAQDANSNDEIAWEVCAERCDKFIMESGTTDENGHLLLERRKAA